MLENALALALCSSFLFGLALVLTQFGLQYLTPREGALISIPCITALLWLSAPAIVGSDAWSLAAALIFLAVGCFYPAAVTLLTYEANRQMGPGIVGALGNLAPLFAVAIAAAILGDLPRPLQTSGIIAIIVGVVLISFGRSPKGASWPRWAIALPIGAAAIRGTAQPIAKIGLALWPSAFAAALLGYSASSVVVAAVAFGPRCGPAPKSWQRGALWFLCVGFCNGGAVLALYAALASGSVTLVSPLVATYPLVTLALTWMFFGKVAADWRSGIGIALTVAGVALLVGT